MSVRAWDEPCASCTASLLFIFALDFAVAFDASGSWPWIMSFMRMNSMLFVSSQSSQFHSLPSGWNFFLLLYFLTSSMNFLYCWSSHFFLSFSSPWKYDGFFSAISTRAFS